MKELIEEYGSTIAVIILVAVVIACFARIVSLLGSPDFWVNYFITG